MSPITSTSNVLTPLGFGLQIPDLISSVATPDRLWLNNLGLVTLESRRLSPSCAGGSCPQATSTYITYPRAFHAPHRGLFLRVHESLCPFLFHPFLCAPQSQASRLEQVALVTRNKRKGIRSLDRFAADLDHDRESDRASAATLSSLCGVLLRWRRLDALDETGWSMHALSALPARRTAVCQRRIQ